MESFVRTFRHTRLSVAVDMANMYAENHGCEIISAQVCVYGDGRPSEESCLTVVLKKIRKRGASKDRNEEST